MSVKPRSEDVVAVVVSGESDGDDDDVLEFYDVVGKGAVKRREEGTFTKTKKVKQFVWEEKEDGMSYVIVTEGGSLIRNGTEEVAGGGVECAACHPKTTALAYATQGLGIRREDVVNLNDVKRIESIAFPNENSDDLVLVSILNGRMSADCLRGGRRTASGRLANGRRVRYRSHARRGDWESFARRPN